MSKKSNRARNLVADVPETLRDLGIDDLHQVGGGAPLSYYINGNDSPQTMYFFLAAYCRRLAAEFGRPIPA
jgi:hypothetical protein